MSAPKRTGKNCPTEVKTGSHAGSGMAKSSDRTSLSCADPSEIARLIEGWKQLPPELFNGLLNEIHKWDEYGTPKGSLLKKLGQIRKHRRESMLIGLLSEAIGESTIRRTLSQQKEARVALLRKATKNFRSTAESLHQLADFDRANAATCLLVAGPTEARPAQTRAAWKTSLANDLLDRANTLERELKCVRGSSLRSLGASAKPKGPADEPKVKREKRGLPTASRNLEWLVQVQEQFEFSFGELALLTIAAHGAWNQQVVDLNSDSLEKAVGRFRKRNPDFARTSRAIT